MKILTFSTLYPHAARPHHGIFVENRLRHLLASREIEARVVAPVPWFPFRHRLFGDYAVHALAPREETRHGIDVVHPRYVTVPKIGMSIAPLLLAAGAYSAVKKIIGQGFDVEVIDAHYFYPDGVAAAMIGQRLGIPVVITARGTDLNVLPRFALPRRMILWAAKRAAALVTVSKALKATLTQLGGDERKISVLRNGVDTRLFRPVDRSTQRARLGITGTTLLMVGNLLALKGHDVVLRALRDYSSARLLIIGEGPEEKNLKELSRALGLQDRVRFLGAMPQERLADYYGAADALVLASKREGWPNVLLESMACGTPVVSTRVGGTPEIVAAPEAGILADEPTARGIVEALQRLFKSYPDRESTRRYAERFGWDETTRAQLALFERISATRGRA
jgi:glycosyltransferase involved in cell wall biosynthesis